MYLELCKKVLEEIKVRTHKILTDNLQEKLQMANRRIKEAYKNTSLKNSSYELNNLLNDQKRLLQKITQSSEILDAPLDVDVNDIAEMLRKYILETPINTNTLKLIIEKIEIGHLVKNEAGSSQRIKVYYRF